MVLHLPLRDPDKIAPECVISIRCVGLLNASCPFQHFYVVAPCFIVVLACRPLDENPMFVLPVVDEEGREINVDFFVFSGLSDGFYADLVHGGVHILGVVLLMNGVFILHLDVEVLCWLSCRVLRRLDPWFLSTWRLWRRRRCSCFLDDGVICTVFGDLGLVMVVGAAICSVCVASGDASSGVVGCRLAWGGGLVIGGGGRLIAEGWRGHSPAEYVGCLPLSDLFL